ncbi:MAG: peptidylprolyl isomerase [Bacillota bacterium]|jgi:peptidyl-prolyl cis-trans isomerase C|nr:peptidylprolyl isomerase [Bacillota bacterium]NLL60919.1 peptidylprolyl isomerase [Tissierellia bacterium]
MENKVLALVEGREIKESDLKLLVKNLGQNAAYFQGEEGRKKLIEELVMHELMYLDAVERNLESEEEFLEVFKEMKRSMLQQYNLRKMFNSITLSDEELKDFYEENKKLYNLPEMVEASHILVETEEKADMVLEELRGGLSFEDAAMKYSSCPSNQSGGALGQFGKGRMVKEFEDAVFSMEVGEISSPVKTQFGYHIIKLTDHTPARTADFEEVYQEVKDNYFAIKQEDVYRNKKAELTKKYDVVIFE